MLPRWDVVSRSPEAEEDAQDDPRFRLLLQRALFQRLIGAEYVVQLAARAGLGVKEATS